MKKTLFFIIGLLGVALAAVPPAAGQLLTAEELFAGARDHDGEVVEFEGEAIRAVLPRGDHAWVNLYDGTGAIGVWVPLEATVEVRYAGTYKVRGDRVRVRGVFRRACPEHQGALDIHADTLAVVAAGGPVEESLDAGKVFALAVLLGVLSCLLIYNLLNRKRAPR